MSENLHHVDDLFRDALNDHEEEAPQKIWDNIDRELDKKKVTSINRKYHRIKWVAAASIIFTCALATYTIYIQKENKEVAKQEKEKESKKTTKATSPFPSRGLRDKADTGTSIIERTEVASQNPQQSQPSRKVQEQNNLRDEQESKRQKGVAKFNQGLASSKSDHIRLGESPKAVALNEQQGQRTDNSKFVAGSRNTVESKTNKAQSEADSRTKADDETMAGPQSKEANESSTKSNNISNNSSNSSTTSNSEKAIESAATKEGLNESLALEEKTRNMAPAEVSKNSTGNKKANSISIEKENATDKLIEKITPDTKLSNFSATVFYSPDFISAKVKSDKPRFREDDRNEIKKTEETKISSSFGVLINYYVGKNWSLLSGLSYSTRVTDIEAKAIYARPDARGNIKYRFNCSAGYSFVNVKSSNTPRSGDSIRSLSATNTLEYINIPVGVKYKIGVGRFSLNPTAALSANIVAKGKIETVIASTGGNERANTKDIKGLKSNYFNGALSVGAEYWLTNNIALTFIPTARFALSSINKDAPVKTYFNSLGLASGLTIKL